MRKGKEYFLLFVLDNLAWFLIIVFYLAFALVKPNAMLNLRIASFILYTMTTIGFLILAEAVALLSGNFDVSIDRITGFVGILSAKLITKYSLHPYVGVFLPPLFGLMCGSLNGLLVGSWGLNPFISTLATQMIFSGLLLITSSTSIWHLPKAYLRFGSDMVVAMLFFFAILVLFWFILRYTRLGRRIYAVGGSPSAAVMSGINLKRTVFVTYCIVGLLCGVAALVYTGFCGSAPTNMANGALFPAFAGAVLGGISLRGGRGSVMNAFAGGLLIGVINAGLAMFAVSEPIRQVSTGVLVATAVVLGNLREVLREKVSRAM